MRISDWSSDVCSSDLHARRSGGGGQRGRAQRVRQRGYDPPARRGVLGLGRDLAELALRGGLYVPGCALCQRLRRLRTGALWRRGPADRGWAPHRSEEHTSELQSLMRISYAVFCLKKKTPKQKDKQ